MARKANCLTCLGMSIRFERRENEIPGTSYLMRYDWRGLVVVELLWQ